MTTEEKNSIAFFVDLASDMARGGYFRGEREYNWKDEVTEEKAPASANNPLVMVAAGETDAAASDGLLDKMLGSIGLSSAANCFIANGGNYEDLIRSRKPRFILCLGKTASQTLLQSAEPIEKLRGKLIDYKTEGMTIPLVATYHPGDLLRDQSLKRPAWDDLKLLRAALNSAQGGGR